MSDIAKLGFSVNTQGLKKGEKALNDFATTGEKTEKRTDSSSKKIVDDYKGIEKSVGKTAAEVIRAERSMAKAQKESEKQLAKKSRSLGQTSIQLQQFIGQLQGGQSFMLAFSQQAADVGIVLDRALLGAVLGISASLIGMFLPSLLNSKSASEKLTSALEELKEITTETDEGVLLLSDSIDKLARKSEDAARVEIAFGMIKATDAINAAREAIDDVIPVWISGLEQLATVSERTGKSQIETLKELGNTYTGTLVGIGELSSATLEMSEDFGITQAEALKLAVAISDFNDGKSIEGMQNLSSVVSELAVNIEKPNKKLIEFAREITGSTVKAANAEEMFGLFEEALDSVGRSIGDAGQEGEKFSSSVEGISTSLEAQIIALSQGEEAAIRWSIAQRLGLDSIEKIPEAIKEQIAAISRLKDELQGEKDLMQEIALDEKFLIKQKSDAEKAAEKARKKAADQRKKDSLNAEKDFEKLTNNIENFGGAWTKTGSVIVDAFGDISDAMNDYMDQLGAIEKNEKELAAFRKEKGADNAEVIALQQKLESDRISAELSGLKSVAKVGESLFAEKTAAAKAFAALNKIITVAEIALSFQKMAAGTAEAGVHVANETTKQSANALTAITSAFAAPFPINFVAGAAMIGIMASLIGGIAGGGSSFDATESRQESQGTGTVLGSEDKSNSILESQERFEDLQIDQLSELRGIRDSLNNVASGIALVARDLVASRGLGEFGGDLSGSRTGESSLGRLFSGDLFGVDFGGLGEKLISGIFGSTKRKVTDSGIQFVAQSLAEIMEDGVIQASQFFDIETTKKKLFGLSKKRSTSTEFQELDSSFGKGIGAIFKNIGDVVLQSAEILGFETVSILQSSLMSPLNGVDFAEFGRGIAGRFAETFEMTEVSLQDALSRFEIDIGKVSFEGLSGEEIEQELQAIFSQQADLIAEFLVPSIAEYQKVGEGLFDTLTRVAQEQVIFNDNIERMGFDLSSLSNVMKIDVAQAIIELTGGLENFADLTDSFFENFFSEAEQLAYLEKSLTEAFDSLGLSIITSREEFKSLIEGIDLTTEEGQKLLAALLEINPALSDYIAELERVESKRVDMTIELLKLQGKAEEALAMEREIELKALDQSLRAIQLLIYAEEDRIALINRQEDAIRGSFSTLEKAVSLEKQRARSLLDVASAANSAELDRISDLRSNLEEENSIRNANLAIAESALNRAFNDRMNRIREGASSEIALIQSNSDARIEGLNGEAEAIKATATSMKSLVGAINSSLGLSGSSNLIAALASARSGDFSKAKSLDISGLSKLDSGGFSSAEELAVQQALNKNRLKAIGDLAQNELTSAEAMLNAIDRQIEATKASTKYQVETIKDQSELQIKGLQEQLDTLLGIDNSVLSISEAINNFQSAQQSVFELGYETQVERLDMMIESANDVYSLHEQAYADELIRLDAILVDNEELLNAALGIETSILSVAEAIAALSATIAALTERENPFTQIFETPPDDAYIPIVPVDPTSALRLENSSVKQEEIKEELRKTREDNVIFQRELIKNTKQTARILQRFELDGLDTRSIT